MPLYNPSSVFVTPANSTSTTATSTVISGSTTSQVLVNANTSRMGLTIVNDSNSVLSIEFGKAATATDYAVRITPNGYYELPFNYTGAIHGIWSTAGGSARIRELV